MEHELKTDRYVFWLVWSGKKSYELRYNDRDFKVNDTLLLRETLYTGDEMATGAPLRYTGKQVRARVRHILKGPIYGLTEGWCILAF